MNLFRGRRIKRTKLDWEEAKDVEESARSLSKILEFEHINHSRIYCYRSHGSKSHSYARIWSLPKIFQRALSIEPAYVIEVLSEKFDRLSPDDKEKVILHELLHIPKNFSGALLPHRGRGRSLERTVNQLFREYKSKI